MSDSLDAPVLEQTPSPAKPVVWDVFVNLLITLIAVIGAQIVLGLAVLVSLLSSGIEMKDATDELMKRLTGPGGFMLVAAPSQLLFGLAALIGAKLSPRFPTPPLGMTRLGLPIWSYPIVMIGALLPLAIGIWLAMLLALIIPPDESAAMLYAQMTATWAIPFILFIAFVPGFMEEIFFRGFMQRRLLRRWSPAAAIIVTSITFGLFHVMPHTVVFATVVGLWLGILAWRTDSIWPSIACHAFVNGIWNVWNIGIVLGYFPEQTPIAGYAIGTVLILGCFVASLWLLCQVKPAAG